MIEHFCSDSDSVVPYHWGARSDHALFGGDIPGATVQRGWNGRGRGTHAQIEC